MVTDHSPTAGQGGTERAEQTGRGRWVVWLAGLVVVLAAGSATAHGLYVVARGSGNSVPIAWLYPVITDGLALVAYTATTRLTGPARRYAWTVVILAAGLSGLAQATYLAGALPPPGPVDEATRVAAAPAALRFGVGAWPAVAAAIAAHLLFLIGAHRTPITRVDAHASPAPGGGVPSELHSGMGLSRPDVQPARCPTVQPGARPILTAGVEPEPQPGARHRDPGGPRKALSPRDRALTVARLHVSRHGALPSVRELGSQAQVSRGTAHTAIQALRAQANGLHVVTDTPDERPEQ